MPYRVIIYIFKRLRRFPCFEFVLLTQFCFVFFSVMWIIPWQMYYKWLAEETGHYWMIQERQWFSVKHPKKNTSRNSSMSLCLSRLVCNKLRKRLYSGNCAKHKTYFVFQRLGKREKPVSPHACTHPKKFVVAFSYKICKECSAI